MLLMCETAFLNPKSDINFKVNLSATCYIGFLAPSL